MKVKRSKSLSPEPSGSQDFKRPKVDEDEANLQALRGNLLNFSDDVLLNIMKYLHPQDLMALSLCCRRLEGVCRDRTLWKIIDCRYTAMAMEDLEKYIKFLQPSTTCIAIRGSLVSNPAFRNDFLTAVRTTCKSLKEFTVEECNINALQTQIVHFPPTIEKLSLKGCAVHNGSENKSYLFKIHTYLPYLSCLILSHCAWLSSHSLMVISKIPNLKELRLNSCQRLSECVAYASLATRFGFKALEILDVRDTALGDSEICCFTSTTTLTHIYLECPSELRTHTQDFLQRWENAGRENAGMQNLNGEPVYEDPNLVQYVVEDDVRWDEVERCLVSDRAVCALGSSLRDPRNVELAYRQLLPRPELMFGGVNMAFTENPKIKTLVVRNYSRVTNHSLQHLAANAATLEYLDVTGTAVTKEGVVTFKNARPSVKLISSFNEE